MAIEYWNEFVRVLSTQERQYWANAWYAAAQNMPRKKKNDVGWTTLRLLLGYKMISRNGRNMASNHARTAAFRGDRPKSPQRQRLLRMFASRNGTTIVRAVAIQRNINLSAYKHWPKS